MNENITHFWQSLSTVSIGVIVTLVGFWVGIGNYQNKNTLQQVK